ncbi:hypothetical protein AGIG_G15227 [Arapaima gigas]
MLAAPPPSAADGSPVLCAGLNETERRELQGGSRSQSSFRPGREAAVELTGPDVWSRREGRRGSDGGPRLRNVATAPAWALVVGGSSPARR